MIKKYNSQATKLEFKSFSKHQINLYKQLQLKHGKNYDPDFDQNFSCDHIFISNNFQFFALFVEYANYDDDEFSSNNESEFDDMKEYVIIVKTFTSINNCLYKEKSSNPQEGLFSPDSLYFAFLCKDGITIINLKNSQKILILKSIENFLNASFDTGHNFYLATDSKLMIKSLKHNFIKNLDFDTGENDVDLYFQTKFLFKKFVIIKREDFKIFQVYDYERQKGNISWKQKQTDYEVTFQIFKHKFLLDHVEEDQQFCVWYIPKGKIIRKYKRKQLEFLSSNIESYQTFLLVSLELEKQERTLIRTIDLLRGLEKTEIQQFNCYIDDNDIPRQISSKLFVQMEDGILMYFL